MKLPAKWMREHFAYSDEDILRILNESKIPILGITGTKDVQADSNDLDNILKLNKENIDVVKIPDMDHMLREFTEEKSVLNLKKQYSKKIVLNIYRLVQPFHTEAPLFVLI